MLANKSHKESTYKDDEYLVRRSILGPQLASPLV